MWHNNRTVVATHAKDGTKLAWAIISGVSGWKRLRPASTDGVTNMLVMLSIARAHGRNVDVYIDGNEIRAVTLK